MISWPYILGALVAVFVLGCFNGYAIRDGAAKNAAVKAYKAQMVVQEKLNEVSILYEAEKKRTARVNTERTNTVKKYYETVEIPAECALPDFSYKLLTSSIRDANIAGESSSILPTPAAAGTPGP
jgi:hypothetical protein